VTILTRIPGRIPLIKIKFLGYDFDLNFVTFPQDALKIKEEKVSEGREKAKVEEEEKENQTRELEEIGGQKGDKENVDREKEHNNDVDKGAQLQTVAKVDRLICAIVDRTEVFEIANDSMRKGMLLALSGESD
jgi:hypothetical protein